jgi:predicted aldo/keto reductase-like oxidoreductase
MLGCREDSQRSGSTHWEPLSQEQQSSDPKIQRYKSLGSTGITVSDVTFGAGALNDAGVVRYAFDRGVTLFDTAALYGAGVSEEIIGRALQGVRDQVCIITKQSFSRRRPPGRSMISNILEASLRKLRSDHVDGLFIHSMEEMDALENDDVLESFTRFKQDGKVRFTGFSTHNERKTLTECVKPSYEAVVDVVMLRYNHMEGEAIEPLIAAVHAKGIGTIAMKTLAGGQHGRLERFVNERTTYPQAAIGWVLANSHIDCAVLSMDTYSLVDSYVAASGRQPNRSDAALLRRYRDAVDHTYCRVTCTVCESSCPYNVAISDVMRYNMYFEDYRQRRKATDGYAALAGERKPLPCRTCSGYCTEACPHGLPVQQRLLRTHELLAV